MSVVPHLNEDGSVTHEWLVGHQDPSSVTEVKVYRYKLGSDLHPFVKTAYEYVPEGGLKRDYGSGLDAVRQFLHHTFPNAKVVETWKEK